MWGHKAWLSSAVFVGVLISPALGADVAISGSILDNAKNPISAIAISATGMAPGNPTAEFLAFTDAAGVFTLVVPAGFTGLIRPARSGYQFSPLSRAYTSLTTNSAGQNFEATELRTTVVIRGVVKDKSDAGIAGVSVLLSNGNTYLTGSDGEYQFNVPLGFSGTVSVHHNDYTFVPFQRNYSKLTEDLTGENIFGTAKPQAFTVSGLVKTVNNNAVAGVTISGAPGNATVLTNSEGRYSFQVPVGSSVTVTPKLGDFQFQPVSRSVKAINSNVEAQDFVAQATLSSSLQITEPGCPLPNARVGTQYLAVFRSTVTTAKLQWGIQPSGPIFDGLTFDPGKGELRGIPLRAGTVDFVVSVESSMGQLARKSCSLTVDREADTLERQIDTTTGSCIRRSAPPARNVNAEVEAFTLSDVQAESPCSPPPVREVFTTAMAQAQVSFSLNNLQRGDMAAVEWYAPNGKLAMETRWPAMLEAGDYCLRAPLAIREAGAGRLPGMWRVRVVLNAVPVASKPFVISSVADPSGSLIREILSTVQASSESCSIPATKSVYLPGDDLQSTWVLTDPGSRTGRFRFQYITPSGRTHRTFEGSSLEQVGQCVWSTLRFSEVDRTHLAGTWTVRVYLGDEFVAATSFVVAVAGDVVAGLTREASGTSGRCQAPPLTQTFRVEDERAVLWVRLAEARAGGRVNLEWISPEGLSIRSRSDIVEGDGSWCFSANLSIRNGIGQAQPGIWTVRIAWNDAPIAAVPFLIAPIEVEQFAISDSATSCEAPTPFDQFSKADRQVATWVRLPEVGTGDRVTFEWVAPGGQVHRTANVNPRAPGGAYFVDAMPTKDLAAGAWAVRIQWNSGTLLTVPFSLVDSTAVVPLATQGLMANREVPREQ